MEGIVRTPLQFTVIGCLLLLCFAGPATAQYMRITTDNPSDPTRIRPNGSMTILTITLDTDHDRDGSTQTCNSHLNAAGCGATLTGQPLDTIGFTITLSAVGGTVAWGTFTAADANFTPVGPDLANSTQTEFSRFTSGSAVPPGLITLGSISVTPVSGSPSIAIAHGPQPINPLGFGTGFGTSCDAFVFPNTYVLADASDLCGTGDWLDADGAGPATGASDNPPIITAPATVNGAQGAPFTITATATDPDPGDTLTITATARPPYPFPSFGILSTIVRPSPTSATISGTPGFNDGGNYVIHWTVSDGRGLNSEANTSFYVAKTDRAPTMSPIANMSVTVRGCGPPTADQTISASDPDGDLLAFSKIAGPTFMTVFRISRTTGDIRLAPGLADSGTYGATVRASDGSLSDEKSFQITVDDVNRVPVADAGGPYTGVVGIPVTFDATGSSDPQGNPLTYSWDFDASNGTQQDATGPSPSHTYTSPGAFTVTLKVTDNGDSGQICSNSATTMATITPCPATVFNGYDTIRLGSGEPYWFAYVQPASGCYSNTDVVLSSFVMEFAGRQVPAEVTKTTVGSDKNGDGIPEIRVSFSKANLRTLFSERPYRHNTVVVGINARTVLGRVLSGTTQLDVVNNGSFKLSAVSPNPLNPEATLTYTISRQGFVRIDMFDIQGRLVRRLVDTPSMAAGTHDVTIDGRGQQGEKLPSGVYYVRGTSSEGEFKRLVTILK
jgi:PKD repeat protein